MIRLLTFEPPTAIVVSIILNLVLTIGLCVGTALNYVLARELHKLTQLIIEIAKYRGSTIHVKLIDDEDK